jgi:hypothetical protein
LLYRQSIQPVGQGRPNVNALVVVAGIAIAVAWAFPTSGKRGIFASKKVQSFTNCSLIFRVFANQFLVALIITATTWVMLFEVIIQPADENGLHFQTLHSKGET